MSGRRNGLISEIRRRYRDAKEAMPRIASQEAAIEAAERRREELKNWLSGDAGWVARRRRGRGNRSAQRPSEQR